MLTIGLDQSTKNNIASHTSFSWTPNSIVTNLGIQLIILSSRLLSLNFNNHISKLQKTKHDLQHTQASWAGKILLAKIYLLPHVLYTFPTIPIPFLQNQLLKLKSITFTLLLLSGVENIHVLNATFYAHQFHLVEWVYQTF